MFEFLLLLCSPIYTLFQMLAQNGVYSVPLDLSSMSICCMCQKKPLSMGDCVYYLISNIMTANQQVVDIITAVTTQFSGEHLDFVFIGIPVIGTHTAEHSVVDRSMTKQMRHVYGSRLFLIMIIITTIVMTHAMVPNAFKVSTLAKRYGQTRSGNGSIYCITN